MDRTADESRTAAEAVRLYRDEHLSSREVAARIGVNDKKVRGWLRDAGVTRKPGPRPAIDPDEVRKARKRRKQPWSQVAADLGVSETGAKKAFRRGYGDTGTVDLHAHLTGAQREELRALWDAVPRPPQGTGHDMQCAEGQRVRSLMRHYHAAGVTAVEIAQVIGVTKWRAGVIIRME